MFMLIDENSNTHICEDCGKDGVKHYSYDGQLEGWYGRWFVQAKLEAGTWDIRKATKADVLVGQIPQLGYTVERLG